MKTKHFIYVIFIALATVLAGCGLKQTDTLYLPKDGIDGYTTYITSQPVTDGSCGIVGGLELIPYTDYNRNKLFEPEEATHLASATICNGQRGIQGIQGLPGPQGVQGIQGIQGLQGIAGPQGIQGLQGIAGDNGINGIDGINGVDGTNGIDGINGTNGVDGAPGLIGQQGPPGLNGAPGAPGIQGIQGIQGEAGIPGSSGGGSVYTTQLCPGDTSALSSFISRKLYHN